MSSLRTFLPPRRHASLSALLQQCKQPQRNSSTFSHLQPELTSRKLPLVHDYLIPTPSHLLNVALADVLPQFTSSSTARASDRSHPPELPSTAKPTLLPPAHHIIYFPPPIPGALLLPDGTDPLQSPGEPFVRRMWAGGSVHWNNSPSNPALRLTLDGGRVACFENIRDVSVKGREGEEKVFVGIERRVGRCEEGEGEHIIKQRLWRDREDDFGECGVVERRNIVFMRARTREQAVRDMEAAKTKMMMPPTDPTYTHTLIPDAKLLFRFSALTYNAHGIHLDPAYCREVEGHRNLLVHGPLSFTLLLTFLRMYLAGESTSGSKISRAQQGLQEVVSSVEYRNLAPLYAGEPLKLCGKRREQGRWEVWAETPEGGVAVRGMVKVERAEAGKGFGDLRMLGL